MTDIGDEQAMFTFVLQYCAEALMQVSCMVSEVAGSLSHLLRLLAVSRSKSIVADALFPDTPAEYQVVSASVEDGPHHKHPARPMFYGHVQLVGIMNRPTLFELLI